MSETLKLQVAGKDRSSDLGRELAGSAAARPDHGLATHIAYETDVLGLRSAESAAEYLDRHVKILRVRNQVDPSAFEGPGSGGLMVRVRRFLWNLLRYQHDWTSFRQNSINVQLSYELEFEKEERKKQDAELEQRIRELEKRETP
jgi:hypothetical protein